MHGGGRYLRTFRLLSHDAPAMLDINFIGALTVSALLLAWIWGAPPRQQPSGKGKDQERQTRRGRRLAGHRAILDAAGGVRACSRCRSARPTT